MYTGDAAEATMAAKQVFISNRMATQFLSGDVNNK